MSLTNSALSLLNKLKKDKEREASFAVMHPHFANPLASHPSSLPSGAPPILPALPRTPTPPARPASFVRRASASIRSFVSSATAASGSVFGARNTAAAAVAGVGVGVGAGVSGGVSGAGAVAGGGVGGYLQDVRRSRASGSSLPVFEFEEEGEKGLEEEYSEAVGKGEGKGEEEK